LILEIAATVTFAASKKSNVNVEKQALTLIQRQRRKIQRDIK